jgi:hypothetical protein
MFLPENINAKLQEEEVRKKAFANIETWSSEIIPETIRPDCVVSVQELKCGDPECSPIDTAVTLTFSRYDFVGVLFVFGSMAFVELPRKSPVDQCSTSKDSCIWFVVIDNHFGCYCSCCVGVWANGVVAVVEFLDSPWKRGRLHQKT